jgi:Family of unknown function (DUF6527)
MTDTLPRCELDPELSNHFWWEHVCVHSYVPRVQLPIGPNGWTITQRKPLTVYPSIVCLNCGIHGFFTDGVWMPL